MTTATAKPPKAPTPEPIPVDHSWLLGILDVVRAYQRMREVLSAPIPNDTKFRDLLSIKRLLDVRSLPPGDMLPELVRPPSDAFFETSSGKVDRMRIRWNTDAAKNLAADLFNQEKRDRLTATIQELLRDVEVETEKRLTSGQEECDRCIALKSFNGRTHIDVAEQLFPGNQPSGIYGGHMVVGTVDTLPKEHPIRNWSVLYEPSPGLRCVILGPTVAPVFSRNAAGLPRKVYDAALAWRLTQSARVVQLKNKLTKPGYDMSGDEHSKLEAALKTAQAARPPVIEPLVIPVAPTRTWTQELTTVIQSIQTLSALAMPYLDREALPLRHLLIAKSVFEVDEAAVEQNLEAALRFAGRWCGKQSHDDCLDNLKPLCAKLDSMLTAKMEAGLIKLVAALEED